MSNVILPTGFFNGILAEGGIFELLGPLVIFGIWIIGAIIKTAAKKGSAESEENSESELKKAIEKRRREIVSRQSGKIQQQTQIQKEAKSRYAPVVAADKPPVINQQRATQWDRQQQTENEQAEQRQRTDLHKKRRPVQRRVSRKDTQSDIVQSVVSHKKAPKKKQERAKVKVEPKNQLFTLLNNTDNLRSAIILKEILDRPIALREE